MKCLDGIIALSLAFLASCSKTEGICQSDLAGCELRNQSPLFQCSTDTRLMFGVKELGKLENGMLVHTWFWDDNAQELGEIYSSPTFGNFVDSNSLTAIGILTEEVGKHYPSAVFTRPDGYEQINESELVRHDAFIKGLIDARNDNKSNSCTKIIDTRFYLCF